MADSTNKIEWDLDCKKGAAKLLFCLSPQRLEITLMSTDDPAKPMRGLKGEVDEDDCRFVLGLLRDTIRRPKLPCQVQIPLVVGFRVFPTNGIVPERSVYASDLKHIEVVFESMSDVSFVANTLEQMTDTLRNRRLASRLHRT